MIQLLSRSAPDWFAPLNGWDFTNGDLRLLLGSVEPNFKLIRAGAKRDWR